MAKDIVEAKHIEGIFLLTRWAAVPVTLSLVWLHHPLSDSAMIALGVGLAAVNVIAWRLNRQIKGSAAQAALGMVMLTVDALAASTAISLFVYDFYTAAYGVFSVVVIEAAVRFGLRGSLGASLFFAGGLAGAMLARNVYFSVRFSVSGYAFWTMFTAMIALAVGILVEENRRRQARIRQLSEEQTRLQERHRLSRELHDTVLKTLHGLAFEAHSLRGQPPTSSTAIAEKSEYIEKVCKDFAATIRALVFDLRNGPNEPIGQKLAETLTRWSDRTGVVSALHVDGVDQVLPPALDHDLRQSLEEGLLNVERHAEADRVKVTLCLDTRLQLEIQDNGHNLEHTNNQSDNPGTGIGLVSVKERAERWGGTSTFSRGPDGAHLTVSLPWPPRKRWVEDGSRR